MKPFSNLKIVEIASVLAGPTVGMFFAELGAEVLKVENKKTGGDVTRTWKTPSEKGKISAYYSSANYLKKSILLDLSNSSDIAKLLDELKNADILITNFKDGDAKKFGLDFSTISFQFPRLIVGEVTGFESDPKRVAYDVVIQAESGYMSMNGTKDSGPLKFPVAIMDILCAHQLKEGLLTALIQRNNSGKGSLVRASLERSAYASLANQASNFLMNKMIPEPIGSLHPNIAPYGETFSCKDGKSIVLAIGSDKQFETLCNILNAPILAKETRFKTNQDRVENRSELFEKLKKEFALHNSNILIDRFIENNVPSGIIKNLEDVFQNKIAQEMIRDEEIEGSPTKRISTIGFKISD